MAIDERPRYLLAARITKARGLKGEVVVVPTDGLPFLLREGMEAWVVPPPLRGIRQLAVCAVRDLAGAWGVTLEGVDSLECAAQLAGRSLLVEQSALAEANGPEPPSGSPVGCRVTDERFGALGVVTDVIHSAAHPIWLIEGPYGEVMLPVVEEFIIREDEDGITARIPDGLLDLALGVRHDG